jgi:hypothetical protein
MRATDMTMEEVKKARRFYMFSREVERYTRRVGKW